MEAPLPVFLSCIFFFHFAISPLLFGSPQNKKKKNLPDHDAKMEPPSLPLRKHSTSQMDTFEAQARRGMFHAKEDWKPHLQTVPIHYPNLGINARAALNELSGCADKRRPSAGGEERCTRGAEGAAKLPKGIKKWREREREEEIGGTEEPPLLLCSAA